MDKEDGMNEAKMFHLPLKLSSLNELRKITPEEQRIEEKWVRAVVNFDLSLSFTTDDKLTTITWVRVKSYLPSQVKKQDNPRNVPDFLWNVARLLNWVEEKWRWAGEVASQLTINAEEERRTVSWMGVASVGQVRTVKLRKWRRRQVYVPNAVMDLMDAVCSC
jgi:hypothetical protein